MLIRSLLLAVTIACVFGAATGAMAQNKFIAAYGSGTACSTAAPCSGLPAAGQVIEGAAIYALTPGDFGSAIYETGVSLIGPGAGATIGNIQYEPTAQNVRIMGMNFSRGTLPVSLFLRGQKSALVENVTFTDIANTGGNGIYFAGGSSLVLRNTSFHNASGSGGEAIRIITFGSNMNVSLEDVQVSGGAAGLRIDASNGGFVRVSIKNSTFTNINGTAISATSGSGAVRLFIDDVTVANSQKGLVANGSNIIGWIGETTIAGNQVGIERTGGANLMSFKNNYIYNNTVNGTPLPQSTTPMGDAPPPAQSAFSATSLSRQN